MKDFLKLVIYIAIGYYIIVLMKYVFYYYIRNKSFDEIDKAFEKQGLWFSI